MRPVYISTGRHPFQVAVAAGATILGVGLITVEGIPRTVEIGMPGYIVWLWLALLLGSGPATIAGAFWRGRFDAGLQIEVGGLAALAASMTCYLLGLVAYSASLPWITTVLVVQVVAAAWWRMYEVLRDLRRLRRSLVTPLQADGGEA